MHKHSLAVRTGEGEALSVLGTNVRFLCEGEQTGHRFSVMEVTLPKDQGPPPHDHPWDEAYYVLEGEVLFQIDNRTESYRAGDFIYTPGGGLHGFKGASEEPARVLVLDAPATAGKFFRDVAREVKDLPQDLSKVPAIGMRHELRFRPVT